MKPRTQVAISRELARASRQVRLLLRTDPADAGTNERLAEMRGIQQALAWALGDNAMAPVKSALHSAAGEEPKR